MRNWRKGPRRGKRGKLPAPAKTRYPNALVAYGYPTEPKREVPTEETPLAFNGEKRLLKPSELKMGFIYVQDRIDVERLAESLWVMTMGSFDVGEDCSVADFVGAATEVIAEVIPENDDQYFPLIGFELGNNVPDLEWGKAKERDCLLRVFTNDGGTVRAILQTFRRHLK